VIEGANLFQFLEKGGPIMYPLGLCSVLLLGIVFERAWSLRLRRILPTRFLIEVDDLVRRGKLPEASTLCKTNDSSIARIFLAGLQHPTRPRELCREALEAAGRQESAKLQTNLGILAAIASVSPLLGLLGTVMGLLQVFRTIEAHGAGNTSIFAGGIYQALITTVVGLIIAIPAFLVTKYFESKVESLVREMERAGLELLDLLRGES